MTNTTTKPTESFAELFEQSIAKQEMKQGEVIPAEVVRVDYNYVVVNAGLKSEAFIPVEEFKNDRGEVDVKVSKTSKTATATPSCPATKLSALPLGSTLKKPSNPASWLPVPLQVKLRAA